MRLEGFVVTEEISAGICSHVFRAIRKCDKLNVVLKCYDPNNVESQMFVNLPSDGDAPCLKEAYFLKKVHGIDGCVKMLDFVHDKLHNVYIVVLEDLFSLGYTRLNKEILATDGFLSEATVSWIMLKLIQTLLQLNQLNILHCDIKPDNIFIHRTEKRIKLLDFNIASEVTPHDLPAPCCKRITCTPDYSPPEVLIQNRPWTPAGEVWSIGVTAFVLLCKKFPFQNPYTCHRSQPAYPEEYTFDRDLRERALYALERGAKPIASPIRLSLKAKDFLISCLHRKPQCRPTLQRLATHPFLNPRPSVLFSNSPYSVFDRRSPVSSQAT